MVLVGKLDPNTSRLVSLMLRLHPVPTAALVLCLNLGRTYTVHCRRKSKRASKWVGLFCQCLVLVRSDFDSIGSAVRVSAPHQNLFSGRVNTTLGRTGSLTLPQLYDTRPADTAVKRLN